MADGPPPRFAPTYDLDQPLMAKINAIATRIYRAREAVADHSVLADIARIEAMGFANLPICMAKTQYSFSADPARIGAPTGHVLPVREVRLAAGAGFLVAICGEVMTMPGLPRTPAAESIRLDTDGRIDGLF